MGKKKRNEYLKDRGISIIDFLPERPYCLNGIKSIPRRGTQDFYMLYIPREEELKPYLIMYENETFVDIGANVGSYSLKIAKDFKNKGVNIIAIEAHPENYKALCRNIELNSFKCIKAINKAVSQCTNVFISKIVFDLISIAFVTPFSMRQISFDLMENLYKLNATH